VAAAQVLLAATATVQQAWQAQAVRAHLAASLAPQSPTAVAEAGVELARQRVQAVQVAVLQETLRVAQVEMPRQILAEAVVVGAQAHQARAATAAQAL
jgi:hypothetical protein